MDEKFFERIEKKYLISKEQKKAILSVIRNKMQKDNYPRSDVINIYFDNDNYDLITQSIDWVSFKEKLRARSYGKYDRVFLEIKTKIHGKDENPGFKRRVMITRDDFKELLSTKCSLESLASRSIEKNDDLQIAKEIDYLIKHFKLKPKIMVRYDRTSFKSDGGLRITFDEMLRYSDTNLSFKKGKHDKIFFKDDTAIMEVKAPGFLPIWLVKAMSSNKIYPTQFSKIGQVYERIKREENV